MHVVTCGEALETLKKLRGTPGTYPWTVLVAYPVVEDHEICEIRRVAPGEDHDAITIYERRETGDGILDRALVNLDHGQDPADLLAPLCSGGKGPLLAALDFSRNPPGSFGPAFFTRSPGEILELAKDMLDTFFRTLGISAIRKDPACRKAVCELYMATGAARMDEPDEQDLYLWSLAINLCRAAPRERGTLVDDALFIQDGASNLRAIGNTLARHLKQIPADQDWKPDALNQAAISLICHQMGFLANAAELASRIRLREQLRNTPPQDLSI